MSSPGGKTRALCATLVLLLALAASAFPVGGMLQEEECRHALGPAACLGTLLLRRWWGESSYL